MHGNPPAAMNRDDILRFEPPVARLLGREIIEVDTLNGGATIRFTAQPEFSNRHGTVQGGLLAAMLDSATALALYTVLPPELTGVTVNLNVSFVRPARIGHFTATSKLLSRDNRYGETSGELRDADGTVVATAVAKLRIVPRKKPE